MARIVKDITGNTLSISQSVLPTFKMTTGLTLLENNVGSFTPDPALPPFTLTFTKVGNLVVMDWSPLVGTITGNQSGFFGLVTTSPIPIEYVPATAKDPAFITGAFFSNIIGYSVVPSLVTSPNPNYGTQDSAAGFAAIPFLAVASQAYLTSSSNVPTEPYVLNIGTNSLANLDTSNFAFQLAAGSTMYHV